MATEYRDEILPRAKKAYGLMADKYGQMLAFISAQSSMRSGKRYGIADSNTSRRWRAFGTNGHRASSYLLTDGLEAPARPSEVDRPVRETNVPMPERTMSLANP